MNPATEGAPKISLTTRVKDYLKGMGRAIEEDVTARQEWVEWHDYLERRRFCQEFRNPSWPWPGSSDIVMPLIDKTLKKATPRFFQTILGSRPIEALATRADDQKNSHNVEMLLGYFLHSQKTRARQQIAYHIDDFNQHGWAPLKSTYVYRRRLQPIHLRRDLLPGQLKRLMPVKDEAEAEMISLQAQQMGAQMAVLTTKEFKEREDSIRQMIADAYDLDLSQAMERKSVGKIFDWFLSGGKESMSVMGSATECNMPGAVAVSPYDCIFPQNTTDIQDAERIAHRMRIGRSHALRLARDNDWDMGALTEILKTSDKAWQADRSSNEHRVDEIQQQSERSRHHLNTIADHHELVFYEVYGWMSEEEFGQQKRISYIVHEDHLDKPVKIRVWNRASGRFPWHITKLESTSRRIMGSRGLPEQLNDIDAEVTLNHRNKQNRAQILTSPSFAYRPGSGFNPESVRWVPGGFYPTARPGQDVMPLPVPPMDSYEDREESILRTWAEEYAGAADFGLANPLSNLTEARTAKEISAITQSAAMTSLVAGSDFGQTLEEIADEWMDMFHAFGPEEIWVSKANSQPIRLMKKDLTGDFAFSMAATITSGGPEARAARSLQRLSTILSGQLAQQMGIKYELDVGEAIRDWLETDDPRFAFRVLRERTPQEIQQIQQQQQQAEEAQRKMHLNEEMSLQEVAEALPAIEKKAPHGRNQRINLGKTIGGM